MYKTYQVVHLRYVCYTVHFTFNKKLKSQFKTSDSEQDRVNVFLSVPPVKYYPQIPDVIYKTHKKPLKEEKSIQPKDLRNQGTIQQ